MKVGKIRKKVKKQEGREETTDHNEKHQNEEGFPYGFGRRGRQI